MKITTTSISRNFLFASVVAILAAGLFACTKSTTTTTTTTTATTNTPVFSSTIGGSAVTFNKPTASYASGLINISASTSTGSYTLVLHVTASTTGTYTLSTANTGWIGTSAGKNYTTDATHTGSITFTTLTAGGAAGSNVAAGTFSFTAIQTPSTSGTGTENVTGGSFYVTW